MDAIDTVGERLFSILDVAVYIQAKIRQVVRYFAADLTALQAAALSGLNRNTVNRLYRALRERILLACEAQRPLFGVVEVDESFFGARRVKGKQNVIAMLGFMDHSTILS